jgi:nucleoside 2-deoxyribosyltransferase
VTGDVTMGKKLIIYTAGKMPCVGEDISKTWRGKLEYALRGKNVDFLHPTLGGCDHSGVDPNATVNNDLDLINNSDLVIGYFDQPALYGTIAEILYAASIGKRIGLVFIKENLSNNYDWRSTHGCTCCWDSINPRVQAHEYWFMERLFVDIGNLGDCYSVKYHKYGNLLEFYVDDIDCENSESHNGKTILHYIGTGEVIKNLTYEIMKNNASVL